MNQCQKKTLSEGVNVKEIRPGAVFTTSGDLGIFKAGNKLKVIIKVEEDKDGVRIDFENDAHSKDSFWFDPEDTPRNRLKYGTRKKQLLIDHLHFSQAKLILTESLSASGKE